MFFAYATDTNWCGKKPEHSKNQLDLSSLEDQSKRITSKIQKKLYALNLCYMFNRCNKESIDIRQREDRQRKFD